MSSREQRLPPIDLRMRTLRRWYRKFRPIPKSANPLTPEELYRTNLVPLAKLTTKYHEALEYLQRRLGRIPGDYLEFGVYNGASMSCLYKALGDAGISTPRLFGFDSFQGLPPGVVHEDLGVWRPGQFSCPRELTERRLRDNGVDLQRITFVEGWFRETLTTQTRVQHDICEASIVMIDCDAYSSAEQALQFIEPSIRSLTFVFFDDWRLNDLDLCGAGEYRAFHEFRDRHRDIQWRSFGAYNRKSKVLLAIRR
jgi:O-methyltransferase